MTLTEHIRHAATSDLKLAQRRRVFQICDALQTYRKTPEMTAAFAIELLVSIGLREEAARVMVAGVNR